MPKICLQERVCGTILRRERGGEPERRFPAASRGHTVGTSFPVDSLFPACSRERVEIAVEIEDNFQIVGRIGVRQSVLLDTAEALVKRSVILGEYRSQPAIRDLNH